MVQICKYTKGENSLSLLCLPFFPKASGCYKSLLDRGGQKEVYSSEYAKESLFLYYFINY